MNMLFAFVFHIVAKHSNECMQSDIAELFCENVVVH